MNALDCVSHFCDHLKSLDVDERVSLINEARRMIHEVSPFRAEPVDCVQWVKAEAIEANDYNPNSVAPPEMELLKLSVSEDGYTQPIVSWNRGDAYEVVDGFHRNRVGRECLAINQRIHGYLPLTVINGDRSDRSDRIASTIRHNRARGKHAVSAMSDIVIELKRRNWTDNKIAKELGMDQDEVLRLTQISGLAEAFKDESFSQAWEVAPRDSSEEILSDVLDDFEPNDKGRIFHTWEKWECFKAGFYGEAPEGMTQEEGEERYAEFLADSEAFENALRCVTEKWVNSCEHYLTNDRMNRIAWLGQASVAFTLGIPSCCRGGFNRLTADQQLAANQLALKFLNAWLVGHGREAVTLEAASGRTDAELY